MKEYLIGQPAAGGKLSWVNAGLLLYGFAGPSAILGLSCSVGSVGFLVAPLVLMLVTAASALGALMLFKLRQEHSEEYTFADLGGKILGGRAGYWWGFCIQQANFLLYLPVAMLSIAMGLQGFADPMGHTITCIDYWLVIAAGICLCTTQTRSLKHTSKLGGLSLACTVVVFVLYLYIVLRNPNPGKLAAVAIGNPEMFKAGRKAVGYTKLALGVSVAAWSYVPSFLTVELSNERVMRHPSDFPKAIALSASLNCIVYLVIGIVGVSVWGWDASDPITLGTSSNPHAWPLTSNVARVLNFFWFLACLVSYALDSIPLALTCQRAWAPSFVIDSWAPRDMLVFGLITLPTFVLGLLMAIFVPGLFCMLAIVTALTVPWANLIYPAVLFWKNSSLAPEPIHTLMGSPSDEPHPTQPQGVKTKRLPGKWKAAAAYVFVCGVALFVVCSLAAAGKLAIAEMRGPVEIGCKGWLISG